MPKRRCAVRPQVNEARKSRKPAAKVAVVAPVVAPAVRRRAKPLRLSRTPSLPSTVRSANMSNTEGSSSKLKEHHVLVDLYAKAVDATVQAKKSRVGRPPLKEPRVKYRRGYCGKLDRQGNRVKCKLHKPNERIALFCEECRLFYHMPCFFEKHFCGIMR